ncbi:MAG TPA: hypothetical protein VE377_10830 [Candidatus Dormibacteraeota bacterium]|nr:hypothetical protein [Candidatus Dormibacteraeota bacterium]
MAPDRHPGITMHKISFGGGFIGLLFAAGSALIFILGLPTLWYFVALAFVLGVGVALFLRCVSTRRSDRNRPLSILAAAPESETPKAHERIKWHRSLKILPRPVSA